MTDSRYTDPPFRITRLSHIALKVADPAASAAFYGAILGAAITAEADGAVYMRAVEESSHHSLILRRSDEGPSCDCIGWRVLTEDDLDRASAWFEGRGMPAEWVEVPGQGRTLAMQHPSGLRFEFTASMSRVERQLGDYRARTGAGALRLDHCQVIVPDVGATGDSLMDMGFRAAEVIETSAGKRIGMFLHRKNNPHDIVLALGKGPRLHHFSFVTPDLQSLFRACDVAGQIRVGPEVERGPGRHGPGNSAFVYFRDPDGHRVELILPPMQIMDPDEPQKVWQAEEKHRIVPWGQPAPQRWREEATVFTGVPLSEEGDLARWTES